MSTTPDRIWELLADRATQGLSDAETRELTQLLRENPEVDPLAFESAAAAASLAFVQTEPLPQMIKRRLEASAHLWNQQNAARDEPDDTFAPIAVIRGRRTVFFAGWVAAAACLAFALAGWWPRIQPPLPSAQQRIALMNDPASRKADWKEWSDPTTAAVVKGVVGDVVWNEADQKGYMQFSGLRANDPSKEQYQLWIVDERGMDQRISGGIFNVPPALPGSAGVVVVPINPQIHTKNAAAFAVTVEEPGGTWVSTMTRRVVIAELSKR